jgi:hypothetical protein
MRATSGTPILFFVVFGAIVIFTVVRMFRFGFKGSMFGARILRTVGEVKAAGKSIGSMTIRVHLLDSTSPDRAIGVELVAKTPLSYQMLPISLSKDGARNL